jgi:hypothetical protein
MALLRLEEAFLFNPRVTISKGTSLPFVDMATLVPFRRDVSAGLHKIFSGGSKFVDGDLLVARITPSLENGKTSLYRADQDSDDGKAFGSTEFIVVRGREGISDTEYAYYVFTSPEVRAHAISSMNGSSGRQRVQLDSLAEFQIDLPSLKSQLSIKNTLGALDDKIHSNNSIQEKLDRLNRAEFELALTSEIGELVSFDEVVERLKVKATAADNISSSGPYSVWDQGASGLLGYSHLAPSVFATRENPAILFGDHTCTLRLVIEPCHLGPNLIPFQAKPGCGIHPIWLYFALNGKQKSQEYRRHWICLLYTSPSPRD